MKGFILVGCLILITLFSLLCLSLMQRVHTQQKILQWQVQSDQAQLELIDSLQVLQKTLSQDPPLCILPAAQSTHVFDQLIKGVPQACLERKDVLEIRYFFVTASASEPAFIAAVARVTQKTAWQKFEMQLIFSNERGLLQ